jgi:hypothetical protein
MRAFTVEARSLDSARGIRDALFQFRPQLTGSDEEGYRISIELGEADSEILAVLNALEQHVTERAAGPARVELDGRGYMMHADTQSQEALRDEPTAAV